ncbi:MAG: alpha/beta fold hydrolase [Pirellulales bacterium]
MPSCKEAACDVPWCASHSRWACAWICLILFVLSAGCASQKFVTMRSMPINPLADPLHLFSKSGPTVSPRTEMLLRRYDLLELYKRDPESCLLRLQELAENEQGGEKIYAVSELAYIIGQRSERAGDQGKALDMYGISGSNAYLYLFSPQMDGARNPYDPQFRGACDLYNGALESSLRLVNKHGTLRPGTAYQVHVGEKTYEIAVIAKGNWKNEDFDHIEFCNDYDVKGLDTANVTYGVGVPLIAVRKKQVGIDRAEDYYPDGLSFPITALLRVTAPGVRSGKQTDFRHHCVLELHDPLESNDIQLASRLVPLQTDLSTPLAYFLDTPSFRKQTDSTLGLIDPNKSQDLRGIYMLEPYDPNRIPVIMVHGLWSSPLTWMPMFNDLRSFQELRQNYQFWFYQYPTGQPFWISATQLRQDLAELRSKLDPTGQNPAMEQMVLVGHSMGGLVSRMQTISSGDEFWRILSEHPFEEVHGKPDEIEKLKVALFFEPNPSIRRVVTIGTPHRGSDFANDYTRWLGRKIIKLPTTLTDTGHSLVRQNPSLFRNTELLTTNTSIDSLSPESPIFPVMLRSKRAPWVYYHNIIGVVPDEGFFNRLSSGSDGVVDFESAHMDDVQSEIMVQSQHQDIHRTPRAILEVRRILREHLEMVRNELRWAERYDRAPQSASLSDRDVKTASYQASLETNYIEGIPMLHSRATRSKSGKWSERLWLPNLKKRDSISVGSIERSSIPELQSTPMAR